MARWKDILSEIATILVIIFLDKFIFKYEDIYTSVLVSLLMWYLAKLMVIPLDSFKLSTNKRILLNLGVSALFIIALAIGSFTNIADIHMIIKASLSFIVSIFVNSEYLKDNSVEKIDNE